MKRILVVLSLAFSLVCCSKVERERLPLLPLTAEDRISFSVPYSVAFNIAHARTDFGPLINISPYKSGPDTLFYVAKYKNGWSLIAADSRVSPVLASGTNENDPLTPTDNVGHTLWVKDLVSMLREFKKNDSSSDSPIINSLWKAAGICHKEEILNTKGLPHQPDTIDYGENRWVRIKTSSVLYGYDSIKVDHLIQTKWGQSYPWNQGLPETNYNYGTIVYPLGCTAVAVGQLLYFLHYNLNKPKGLYHNISFSFYNISYNPPIFKVNVSRTDYNSDSDRWDYMPLNRDGSNISYVRDFLIDLGQRLDMIYTEDGSGTDYIDNTFFSQFNVQCISNDYHTSGIRTSLMNGVPVLIMAEKTDGLGHTWLIDGMIERQWTYRTSYTWRLESDGDPMYFDDDHSYYTEEYALSMYPDLYDGMSTYEDSVHSQLYLLMNWGCNGDYDNVEYAAFGSSAWVTGILNQNVFAPGLTRRIIYNFQ